MKLLDEFSCDQVQADKWKMIYCAEFDWMIVTSKSCITDCFIAACMTDQWTTETNFYKSDNFESLKLAKELTNNDYTGI